MEIRNYLLTLSCTNRPGIVAAVSKEIFDHQGDILEAHQFDDRDTGQFFTRILFGVPGRDLATLRARRPRKP